MGTQYSCLNPRQAALVRDARDSKNRPVLNGIDYLVVLPSQTTLDVHFIHDLSSVPGAQPLTLEHVVIRGGVRVPRMRIKGVTGAGNVLTVEVEAPGDFSTYTLAICSSLTDPRPPQGFDPQLSEIQFCFKVDCPSAFDCRPREVCLPERPQDPEIDYLAKDYDSFRRLMLDRLSVILPDWRERNPADLLVALVELLAYVGDHLSYAQDAVATEAYLGTAHHRVSVRRHARLLDYPMHDGCNSRAWVTVQLKDSSADGQLLPGPDPDQNLPGTLLLTRSDAPEGPLPKAKIQEALIQGALAFETLHDVRLFFAHNMMPFYTWGDQECCLPKGATRATLGGHFDHLERGMVLIFEEVKSPTTGAEADANPAHRHAVRLTEAVMKREGSPLTDPLNGREITEIAWAAEDALPFPLCVSACTDKDHGQRYVELVSVARGNVVLADHGRTCLGEDCCEVPSSEMPYRMVLKECPVTQQGRVSVREGAWQVFRSFDPLAPASQAMHWIMGDVLPVVRVVQDGSTDTWEPQKDLLNSDRFDQHMVLEVEDDGQAKLRFGDGELGEAPRGKAMLKAIYRVGNGRAGNIGAGTLVNVVLDPNVYRKHSQIVPPAAIAAVRNPMPAQKGTDPEPLGQVKLYAPQAFRVQERAVTEVDYAGVAERHPEVQKAAATFRWTGSWLTVFVTIDRKGGRELDQAFLREIKDHIGRYRLAGYDLELNAPIFVPLEIILTVCAKPGHFRSQVKESLLEALGSRDLEDGRQGFFHPDRLTFGQPVYLSQLYQAAMEVPGVASLTVDTFKRFGQLPNQEKENGVLRTGRLEIARLENDPSFPEHGTLEVGMVGGI